MPAPTSAPHALAYDDEGAGTPVVFLHGLTFDRRSWRPIIERLEGSLRSIAVDLPAHGGSLGVAVIDQVPGQVHELLAALGVERPIVVGHSMAGGIACMYGAAYPTHGLVVVDNGPDITPFAALVRRLAPALRGPGFSKVWQTFEDSLGLERIPEPVRSRVLDTHHVEQDVVRGYWDMMLRSDPAELQTRIDAEILPRLDVPVLGVFGRPVTDREHERFSRLRDVQLEEWPATATLSTSSIPTASPPGSASSPTTAQPRGPRATWRPRQSASHTMPRTAAAMILR